MEYRDTYGLTPMSFQEELDAPDTIRETRMCKVEIANNAQHIIRIAEQAIKTARRIPETDDPEHASLVQKYAEGINKALIGLLENERLRYSDG